MRKSIHTALLLIPAALASCTVQEVSGPRPEYDNILKIQTSSQTAGTKSLIALGSDMVYAYPFSLDGGLQAVTGVPIPATSIIGSEYTYYMPQPSQDIIFTNVIDGNGGYEVTSPADGDTLMKITLPDGTSGSDVDLVLGDLRKDSIDPDNPEVYPVHLSRKVAQVSLTFQVKEKESGELIGDLSEFFSEVSVSIPTYSTLCLTDFSSFVYYGLADNIWSSAVEQQSSQLRLADGVFVFPSSEAFEDTDHGPAITLKAVSPTGNTLELQSELDYPIEANTHYNLTLSLRQKSDAFDFEIESIIQDTMDVDLEYTDVFITPSLGIEMSRAEADTLYSNPGLTLGEDTLYCYPFLDANGDSLAAGYPKAQTAILNGQYLFNIPTGTQNLIFSNINLTDGVSKYYLQSTIYHSNRPLLYDEDLYVLMRDKETPATEPLYVGKMENFTPASGGSHISVPLEHVTTGFRVLLKILDGDSTVFPSMSDLIQYYWTGIDNQYCPYNLLSGISYASNDYFPTTAFTEAYTPDRINPVLYKEQELLMISDYLYTIINTNHSGFNVDISLDILTPSGTTGSFYTYFDPNEVANSHNTVILPVDLDELTF